MRVLILGANGFIGQHLAKSLAADTSLILTLFSRKFDPELLKLKRSGVNFITGNYNNPLDLSPVIRGQDIIYHLISESVASSSWNNPQAEVQGNLLPTIQLLQLCVDLSVKKIVFASSGGTVYGQREEVCTEKDALHPFSPYGIVKVAIENFLEYFRVRSGLNYDVYRISNPYGPGLNKPGFGVINTWLRAVAKGEKIRMYGDGKASKDYIYIDDLIHFLGHSINSGNESEVYNVSSGEISSLNDIVAAINRLDLGDMDIERLPGALGDNKIVRISNQKILSRYPDFNFTSLEEGIAITSRSVKSEIDKL